MSDRNEQISQSLALLNRVVVMLAKVIATDRVGRSPGDIAPARGAVAYTDADVKTDFSEFSSLIAAKCKILTSDQFDDAELILDIVSGMVPSLQNSFNSQFNNAVEKGKNSNRIQDILAGLIKTQIDAESQSPNENVQYKFEFVDLIVQECIDRLNETLSDDLPSFVAKIRILRVDKSVDFKTSGSDEAIRSLKMDVMRYIRSNRRFDLKNIQRARSGVGTKYIKLKKQITESGIPVANFEAFFIFEFIGGYDKYIFTLMHGPMALESKQKTTPLSGN